MAEICRLSMDLGEKPPPRLSQSILPVAEGGGPLIGHKTPPSAARRGKSMMQCSMFGTQVRGLDKDPVSGRGQDIPRARDCAAQAAMMSMRTRVWFNST